jgi:CRP-like cAMP-binding protein
MPELDPATLAERVLRLSRAAPFDLMTTEELTVIAAGGREQVFPTRTVLVNGGERAAAHYVPLTGRLRLHTDHVELETTAARSGMGVLSVLGRVPLPGDLVAEPGAVLLILDRDVLLNMLEEHGGLCRTVLRLLASKLLELRGKTSAPPVRPSSPPRARWDLVSRMLMLREALGLGMDGLAMVSRLARATHAGQFPRSTSPWTADRTADVLIPVEGSLRLSTRNGVERTVSPGEVLGLVESVAGVPMEGQATAIEDTTALVLSHAELAEAIEDEDALCFELIRSFAAQMWSQLTGRSLERQS